MFLDIGAGASSLWHAVRRRTSRWTLPSVAIAGAFVFVLVGAATLAVSLGDLERGFEQVRYTERILRHAAQLGAQISRAELAARGYMVAEEASYLEQLNAARRGISREVRRLGALSADNPAQLGRLDAIDKDLRQHLGAYDKPLVADGAQLKRLLTHLRSGGLRMDENLDAALSGFRDAEFQALRQRQARAAREVTDALVGAVLALVLALISVAAGLYLIARMRGEAELEKVREEFAHISRLNAMGEVATMLAHDVKQPLTASSNYLSVVKRQLANDEIGRDKIAETVDKISAQVGRAVNIIQRLRNHIGQTGSGAAPEEVGDTITEAIALSGIEHTKIPVDLRLKMKLPQVCIDKVQIEQVLVNLICNAMDAMADRPRNAIVISAERTDYRMVRIAVRDSGPGLPADVRENLFKPFVTTKPDGMGVGLSICHSIIQAHGGTIDAASAPDGGTIFTFTVPEA